MVSADRLSGWRAIQLRLARSPLRLPRSAERHAPLPEFQHLAVGDHIPVGRGPSWPVAVLEPDRALVLDMRNMGGLDWVWQFGLYPIDETRTRLISRSRVRAQAVWARLLTHAIEPAGFVMTRRMLLGLKQRAEALRAANAGETRANRRPAA